LPPISQITAPMAVISEKVYCSVPEAIITTVMGQIFGKMGPILTEAEKFWLPPGQAHCPYLQTRLACILKGYIPRPDLLIPIGITCDQAPKTDEIIGELYGVPVAHADSCNDEDGTRWPYVSLSRIQYLAQELKNIAKLFEKVIGLEFTARHALASGYYSVIAEDAAGAYTEEAHARSIAFLRSWTPVVSTDEICRIWSPGQGKSL